jgi:hypothetical protein
VLRKVLVLAVRSTVRGPGKSWVFTSGALMAMRAIQSKTRKTEIIDLSKTKPGDRIVIEHLDITHEEQIKAFKRAKKADKRSSRDAKRLARKS